MALLDQVRKLEAQVIERLKELEPLIGEYHKLRQVAQRLGVSYTPPPEDAATTAAPARRKATAKNSGQAKRAEAKPPAARRTRAKRAAKPASPKRSAGSTATRSAGKPSTAAKPTAPTAPTKKTSAPSRRGRTTAPARTGQRRDDVLRVIAQQPGISVREIGERLGVDATGLYRVANKLTAERHLRKDGTRLYVIEPDQAAQPATTAEPTPDGSTSTRAQPRSPDATTAGGDAPADAETTSST